MKAHESVNNFYPTMRMYTNFAVRGVKKTCAQFGAREAGGEAEYGAQKFMAEQIGDAADSVTEDSFRLAPRAFLGWLRPAGLLLLLAIAANIVNLFVLRDVPCGPIAALALCAVPVAMLLCFLFYGAFTAPFSKKAESHNLYCVRKPAGEVKRRIVFAGHADSAPEWTPVRLGGAGFLRFTVIYAVLGLVYTVALSVVWLARGETPMLPVFAALAFAPGDVLLICFINFKVYAQGANNDLSGCMTAAAVMKFMGDNDLRLQNTELAVLFAGAGEAGLGGAKAAAKQREAFADPSVETVVIALNAVKEYDGMTVYDKMMFGRGKAAPAACALLGAAGKICGLTLKNAKPFAGTSDAGPLAKAGVPAVGFGAATPANLGSYYTGADTCDALEPKTVEKTLELMLETAFLFDEQGLRDHYEA